jgi:hypothetical protein
LDKVKEDAKRSERELEDQLNQLHDDLVKMNKLLGLNESASAKDISTEKRRILREAKVSQTDEMHQPHSVDQHGMVSITLYGVSSSVGLRCRCCVVQRHFGIPEDAWREPGRRHHATTVPVRSMSNYGTPTLTPPLAKTLDLATRLITPSDAHRPVRTNAMDWRLQQPVSHPLRTPSQSRVPVSLSQPSSRGESRRVTELQESQRTNSRPT